MRFHVIRGDSAGGTLQQAIRLSGGDDAVLMIADDLSYGPLSSDQARDDWWKSLKPTDLDDFPSVYRAWQNAHARLIHTAPRSLVVWTSDDVNDCIFVRMACDQLRDFDGAWEIVEVPSWGPPGEKYYGVGMYGPDELAQFLDRSRPLLADERQTLARSWHEIPLGSGVRVIDGAMFHLCPYDIWDDKLLSHIGETWTRPIVAIGKMIGWSFGQNSQNDRFLTWRIEELVASGVIEIRDMPDADPKLDDRMRTTLVRRV
ncbi:MAG: DUF1835 domain-containing protein [Micropepsaceae bacterium]